MHFIRAQIGLAAFLGSNNALALSVHTSSLLRPRNPDCNITNLPAIVYYKPSNNDIKTCQWGDAEDAIPSLHTWPGSDCIIITINSDDLYNKCQSSTDVDVGDVERPREFPREKLSTFAPRLPCGPGRKRLFRKGNQVIAGEKISVQYRLDFHNGVDGNYTAELPQKPTDEITGAGKDCIHPPC